MSMCTASAERTSKLAGIKTHDRLKSNFCRIRGFVRSPGVGAGFGHRDICPQPILLPHTEGKRMKLHLAAIITLALTLAMTPAPLAAQTPAGMTPFTMNSRAGALDHSPVDVSFLLDAPAGKHGFIVVRNGHLATADGQRIRFWGVNITDWSPGSQQIPAKKDAEFWAETLARFGVNMVRFQFLDLRAPRGLIDSKSADTQRFDSAQMDREDYFIAQLEKRGIYIDFNLLVGRPFSEADGVVGAERLGQGAKGTSLFDTRLIELEKQYARELLSHNNPYTGRKYTDDPATALVEINNEDAIDIGYRAPFPFYLRELTGIYNDWLAKHRTPAQVAELRKLTDVQGDAPVPLMQGRGQAPSAPPLRFYAEAEFYRDLQKNYFADMEDYLKQTLGLKSLVIATADHSHTNSGYPMLQATTSMDVIDGHDYWEHPEEYVRKSAMVNDPEHSTVVALSRSAIAGKPYTVSEVNEPFPNDYDGEQIPILASYGLLQDWDAILWYTFEPKASAAWQPYVGDPFDISLDPVKMPELAEGALMFLRGDVSPAHTTDTRSYSAKQVYDSMLLPMSQAPYFTPGFPLCLPLEHEVRISSFDGPPTHDFPKQPMPNPIVADTGQLAWYTSPDKTGMVTIDAPRTQGLIGFVSNNSKSVTNLAANVDNRFCTILLSSLDDKPIAQSAKLLLIAAGRMENTGQQWNSAGTAGTNWGGTPSLIAPVKGTLTLRHVDGARAVLLQPINGAGQPEGAVIHAKKTHAGWVFPLGTPTTTWYEIKVER